MLEEIKDMQENWVIKGKLRIGNIAIYPMKCDSYADFVKQLLDIIYIFATGNGEFDNCDVVEAYPVACIYNELYGNDMLFVCKHFATYLNPSSIDNLFVVIKEAVRLYTNKPIVILWAEFYRQFADDITPENKEQVLSDVISGMDYVKMLCEANEVACIFLYPQFKVTDVIVN